MPASLEKQIVALTPSPVGGADHRAVFHFADGWRFSGPA